MEKLVNRMSKVVIEFCQNSKHGLTKWKKMRTRILVLPMMKNVMMNPCTQLDHQLCQATEFLQVMWLNKLNSNAPVFVPRKIPGGAANVSNHVVKGAALISSNKSSQVSV